MKIGIILYSNTNNTLTVGQRLNEALRAAGHEVALLRVMADMENNQPKLPITLREKPDASAYDYVIFGAPVQAFTLSPVMKAYMAQLSPLRGQKTACFVTQHFKKTWMGGNQAISKLSGHIKRLGGTLTQTAIVNWSSEKREEQIGTLVRSLARVGAGES